MQKRRTDRLLALILAAGLASAPAAAEPAMWTVSDEDTLVHLFGTVHMLAPGATWRTPALDEALESADTLWLEIDLLNDTTATMALLTHGTSPKLPLKQRLSADDYAELEAKAASLKVEMASIERLRPWLAAITLAVAGIQRSGFDATGVDPQLARQAGRAGTPVRGFETAAQQLAIFAGIGPEAEIEFLMETVRTMDEMLDVVPTMFEAWHDGDRDRLDEVLVTSLAALGEDFAAALLTDRNRAWAEQFEEIMAEPGRRVVAVGAGHLVGKDSLPDLLADKGWTVELVQGKP